MGRTAMSQTIVLDTLPGGSTNFDVLGVSCQEKDYRFCWLLHKHLDWRLVQESEPESQQRTAGPVSVFFGELPDLYISIRILQLPKAPKVWIQEAAGMDYLIQLTGNTETFLNEAAQNIRNIPEVQWCGKLQKLSDKAKAKLIYQ